MVDRMLDYMLIDFLQIIITFEIVKIILDLRAKRYQTMNVAEEIYDNTALDSCDHTEQVINWEIVVISEETPNCSENKKASCESQEKDATLCSHVTAFTDDVFVFPFVIIWLH